jgi:hypothetical protein
MAIILSKLLAQRGNVGLAGMTRGPRLGSDVAGAPADPLALFPSRKPSFRLRCEVEGTFRARHG